MSVQLPEYLSVGDDERGQSLGIDWDSYRRLSSTALAIIGQNRPTMGLYKKNGLAALDIFNRRNCLTIIINSTEKRLSLFLCPMDERLDQAVCLLETSNDARNWRKLLRLAQKHFV